ncbi:MAG: GNAT family N-acetyltransferase [Actinomycetota bacterium]
MTEIAVPITIRDLSSADLEGLGWSGSPAHLRSVRGELGRVPSGKVDYLAACPPSNVPVGKTGIDHTRHAGASTIYQAAVHPALQSCGIGTLLIRAAEERIRSRGHDRAELAAEHGNPRARALYERLGYTAYGDEPDEWDAEGPDGRIVRYRAMCSLMRKPLRAG